MNPQEFANKIRTKYPGAYDSLSDDDLTNKIVAKYPIYASQVNLNKQGQLPAEATAPFSSMKSRTEEFGQDLSQFGQELKSSFNKRKMNIDEISQSSAAGEIGIGRSMFQKIGQSAGLLGDVIGAGVKGVVKGALPQAGEDMLKAGISKVATPVVQSDLVQGLVNKYENIKQTNPVLAKDIDAVLGIADFASNFVGIGWGGKAAKTATSFANTGIKTGTEIVETGVKQAVPKLLSYTSDVPESAFKILADRTPQVSKAIQANLKPEQILDNTRTAVRTFRKTLSDEWDSGVESIIKENTGLRYGLSDSFSKKITTVADEFGIDLPQNLKNISALESITLLKKINELPKAMLTFSPKGALLRDVKSGLKELAVKSFGGEKGAFNNLYKNYSTKKNILDSANDIVNAYATGKPIKSATAQSRLMKIFDDNKTAYLDAIVDLEKATGQDILSGIAAGKFSKIMPTVSSIRGGITEKLLKVLVLPLTSPRATAWIQTNINKATGRIKNFVETPKAGLSIGNITKNITPAEKAILRDFTDLTNGAIKSSDAKYVSNIKRRAQEVADKYKFSASTKGDKALSNQIGEYLDSVGFDRKLNSTNKK